MSAKILLADDEAALRLLLFETLSGEGYVVSSAEDGAAAMELLRKETFDLVILDCMMPVKTGLEVCEWLRTQGNGNRNLPVIMLTAKSQDKDRDLANAAGVSHYMVKPFSPLSLIDTIKRFIGQP